MHSHSRSSCRKRRELLGVSHGASARGIWKYHLPVTVWRLGFNKCAQNAWRDLLDRLEEHYGSRFSDIFKTITVDNGSEFLNRADGALHPLCSKSARTSIVRTPTARGNGEATRTRISWSDDLCPKERILASLRQGISNGLSTGSIIIHADSSVTRRLPRWAPSRLPNAVGGGNSTCNLYCNPHTERICA